MKLLFHRTRFAFFLPNFPFPRFSRHSISLLNGTLLARMLDRGARFFFCFFHIVEVRRKRITNKFVNFLFSNFRVENPRCGRSGN